MTLQYLVVALGIWTGTSALASSAPLATYCRPADSTSSGLVVYFQNLATTTDPRYLGLRDSLQLTLRRASDVSLVTSETTCQKAAAALDALWQSGTTNRQVYVLQLGSDYGVHDPAIAGGIGGRGVEIFDRKWNYKTGLLLK